MNLCENQQKKVKHEKEDSFIPVSQSIPQSFKDEEISNTYPIMTTQIAYSSPENSQDNQDDTDEKYFSNSPLPSPQYAEDEAYYSRHPSLDDGYFKGSTESCDPLSVSSFEPSQDDNYRKDFVNEIEIIKIESEAELNFFLDEGKDNGVKEIEIIKIESEAEVFFLEENLGTKGEKRSINENEERNYKRTRTKA